MHMQQLRVRLWQRRSSDGACSVRGHRLPQAEHAAVQAGVATSEHRQGKGAPGQ